MIDRRDALARTPARDLALSCLEVGLAASDPERVIADGLSLIDDTLSVGDATYDLSAVEKLFVVGGGKAGGQQARAIEDLLGDRIERGIVVTNDPVETERITVRRGDHPVPSERGVAATRELLDLVESADADTLVLVLISGGGSALLPAPADGISLDELQRVTEGLLESGATIDEINAVRKHLSAIKGGQLARAAAPARVVGLVMSDVVGDDLSVIASGPTVPDDTTYAEARAVLERFGIDLPSGVAERLAAGERGDLPETPDPDDPLFDRVRTHLLADAGTPVRAAAEHVRDRGLGAMVLSSRIRGESREAAKSHVAIGEEMLATGQPLSPPAVVLSGGETTVTVRGGGTGGPNLEFALSAAIELRDGITVAAIDTDGIDGASPVAGGLVDAGTVEDRTAARDALSDNDAYPFLQDRDDVIETGPTGTNVNDFRVMVVDPAGAGDAS